MNSDYFNTKKESNSFPYSLLNSYKLAIETELKLFNIWCKITGNNYNVLNCSIIAIKLLKEKKSESLCHK